MTLCTLATWVHFPAPSCLVVWAACRGWAVQDGIWCAFARQLHSALTDMAYWKLLLVWMEIWPQISLWHGDDIKTISEQDLSTSKPRFAARVMQRDLAVQEKCIYIYGNRPVYHTYSSISHASKTGICILNGEANFCARIEAQGCYNGCQVILFRGRWYVSMYDNSPSALLRLLWFLRLCSSWQEWSLILRIDSH